MKMLTPSNLGDCIALSNLGEGGNPPEFNNSRFLHWISIKFCMVVGPHETNLNVYFRHDWMKYDVTVTSQRIWVTMLGCQLRNLSELNNSRFLCWISMKFCMVVDLHKTNLNVDFWHD